MTEKRNRQRVQRKAYAVTGNATEAQILAALWWWEPYATVSRGGYKWVVKTDGDFIQSEGVTASPRTVRAAIERLRERDLVCTMRGRHPNGRAPNSRYLRLTDQAREHLDAGRQKEKIAQTEDESVLGSRPRTASTSDSDRPAAPPQEGDSCRIHIQEDIQETSRETGKGERTTARGKKKNIGEESQISEEDLEHVQTLFDWGCRNRKTEPHPAPRLDTSGKRRALRKFVEACQAEDMSIDDAGLAAAHFAYRYEAESFAMLLGRGQFGVSRLPNHFVLQIAANYAISDWKDGADFCGWEDMAVPGPNWDAVLEESDHAGA